MNAQSSFKCFLFGICYTVKNEPGLYCFAFITSIFYAVVSKFIFLHIGQIINSIPNMISEENGSLHDIISLLLTLLVLYIIQTVAYGIYQNIANVLLPSRMDIKLQRDIVQLTDNIPLHNFDLPDFCNTYSEATSTIAGLHQYVTSNIFIIQCAVSLIIAGTVLFQNSFILLLVFILSGVAAVFITRQNAQLNFELWERSNAKRRLNSYVADLFFRNNSNKEIRLFHLSQYFVDKYKQNVQSISDDEAEVNQPIYLKIGRFVLFQQCVSILVVIIGLFYVSGGKMPVGNLFTIFTLTMSSLGSINEFRQNLENWQLSTLKINTAKNFIDEFSQGSNEENDRIFVNQNETDVPAICFQNVCFAYLPDQPVLHDIHLSISPGEVVALIGENGSGKSTLMKLLCGLYQPSSGAVNIVGIDPYVNRREASAYISTVFQDFARFPLTLRENIALGALEDMQDDEKIKAAMKEAGLEYLEEKVGGLDRTISKMYTSDGIEISTGEWQKVAIARAYMGNKQIMIFDEPTASLDPLSEIKLFQSICSSFHAKTILFTSHRIGLAKMADRIIVLDHGRIVENGSHETLMKHKGKYYELFQAQAKWYQ